MAKSLYDLSKGGKKDFENLTELDTHLGSTTELSKKNHELIDAALKGEIVGKRANKTIEASEALVEISKKGVLDGSVPVSELGAGKSWWGRVKSKVFGDTVSTDKVRKLAKELHELKSDQAAGITGLEGKIEKKSAQFLQEAKKVLPNLPHFQQSAAKALAVVEQQERKAVRAAEKGIEVWATQERKDKIGELKGEILKADFATKTVGKDTTYSKWDTKKVTHVVDTDKLEKAAKKEFDKTHKKEFNKLIKEKQKQVKDDVADLYKDKKKQFKKVKNLSTKTMEGIEEQTGLKATDVVSTKGKEALAQGGNAAAAASLKADSNFLGGSISGNWKKAGPMSKVKLGVGAIGMYDGIRRIFSGVAPGEGPDGQPQGIQPFQILVGVGETALGATVAGHGGHIR